MRALLLLSIATLLTLSAGAQTQFLHYDCLSHNEDSALELAPFADEGQESLSKSLSSLRSHRSTKSRLPSIRNDWDSTRVYPVCVLLLSFTDRQFSSDDPQDFYQRIFNEAGYNEGRGPGCVADYFVDQSGGFFHPRFDIYGPITLPVASNVNEQGGSSLIRQGLQMLYDSLAIDFSPYDWDGDGRAEHVVGICAGYGGNEVATEGKGYIWPTTGSFSALTLGGVRLSGYSLSAELWSNNRSCGIGTICHEYSHTLGLPDIYPTNDGEYSVCDEWDLMDGGNFINNGWCPPSYTAHERMLMGWFTPEELTDTCDITALQPIAEGGKAYIIRTANPDEFFLLENRQWRGWDLRTPGHGLLIAHVDYKASAWSGNTVNNDPAHHRYDYVHADNLGYSQWAALIPSDENPRVGGHNRILSTTPYPIINDSLTVDALTDATTPAATTFVEPGLLSRPITNIREDEQGLVSFSFLREVSSAIAALRNDNVHSGADVYYDLQGRPHRAPLAPGIYIHNGRKLKK